ncbi:hypothetical protein [Phytoactinopolyspora halophila]|uniref:hypothetical protein n=1 Tax=Phytoactinopolyspora halophila TaxID=1981511 RepID=UPI001B8D64EA|nr:hypothetical protein [Phytoactinopolyspora halophila]
MIEAATVSELTWLDAAGRPDAWPVTPLWLAEQPVVACPYASDDFARGVAGSPTAALVLSDQRMSGSRWSPLAITVRPRLIEDRDGSIFTDQLLVQELRKYPPARALLDSVILRREHWWYVPRLLIVLEMVSVTAVGPRVHPGEQVLSVATDRGLVVDTASTAALDEDRLQITSLLGHPLPEGDAALLGHDFSIPDLERWTPWITRGRLTGDVMDVDEYPTRTALEPTLGLRQRLRRHRDLEKGCRRALER